VSKLRAKPKEARPLRKVSIATVILQVQDILVVNRQRLFLPSTQQPLI